MSGVPLHSQTARQSGVQVRSVMPYQGGSVTNASWVPVNVIFGDMKDATRKAEADESVAVGDLRRYQALIETTLRQFSPTFFKVTWEGDGFMARFSDPFVMVVCGCAIQRALREGGWEVRLGGHTGYVLLVAEGGGDDPLGSDVNRAKRIAAAADAGSCQFLVSDAVETMIRDRLRDRGIGFGERLETRGDGIPGGLNTFEVQAHGDLLPVTEGAEQMESSMEDRRRARSYALPYRSILGPRTPSEEYGLFDVDVVRQQDDKLVHGVPVDDPRARNLPSCSFGSFRRLDGNRIQVTFLRTDYHKFLQSERLLTEAFPRSPRGSSYRRHFIETYLSPSHWDGRPFDAFPLSNICGVGLFLLTADGAVILSKHPASSHVYPNAWTYTASGTLRWGDWPSPLTEAMHRAHEEFGYPVDPKDCAHEILGYQVDPQHLRLIDIGVDTRKLYFQFSVVDRQGVVDWDRLRQVDRAHRGEASPQELRAIPLTPDFVGQFLFWNEVEPAARSALTSLCESRFGPGTVGECELSQWDYWEDEMRREWTERGRRPAPLADMTDRYPAGELDGGSQAYINKVVEFMQPVLEGSHSVVEVGSGTGRLTERLLGAGRHVTCIEFSEPMLSHHRERLGGAAARVTYFEGLAQDYRCERPHDVAVCSLVLVHNVPDAAFRSLVERVAKMARTIFVFEDFSSRNTSTATALRSESDVCAAFEFYGFSVTRREPYKLFDDSLLLLEFRRGGD